MPLFRIQALTACASSPLAPSTVSLPCPWPFPLSLARSYTSFQGCGGNGWWDLTTIELKSTIGSTQTVRACVRQSGMWLAHRAPGGMWRQLEHPTCFAGAVCSPACCPWVGIESSPRRLPCHSRRCAWTASACCRAAPHPAAAPAERVYPSAVAGCATKQHKQHSHNLAA